MQHTFYVSGIFCPACRLFIEQQLSGVDGVSDVRVDEVTQTVTLTLGSQYDGEAWLVVLNQALTAHGYTLGIAPPVRDNQTIWHALPLGLLLLYGFIVAQQSGWLHFDFQHSIAPASAFLLGLIASTSSCLLVVGGLVLSLSAQPQLPRRALFEFHVGRLAGFVLLGAVLGGLGQVLDIGLGAWLGLFTSLLTIVLGLHLTGALRRYRLVLPRGWLAVARARLNRWPLLLGVSTFVLPCGFTQSVQVSALASHSPLMGAWLMGAFVLGTLPMLALLTWGGASLAQSRFAPLFVRTAGVLVVGFGGLTLLTGLASLGLIPPVLGL
jgi:sulfite exporter TauE/SafE/copper chaperone CopZ